MKSKFFCFDIDGTLTKSKAPIDEEMAKLLEIALDHGHMIAFLTGASINQIQDQVVSRLDIYDGDYTRIWAGATSGARIFNWTADKKPQVKFEILLTPIEKAIIATAFESIMSFMGLQDKHGDWGDVLEDRDSQITFSGLGQLAPLEAKRTWDPDRAIRMRMLKFLNSIPSMASFQCRIGGTTSIDVSRKDIDKGFGIAKLIQLADRKRADVLYFGDAFEQGGNDAPVFKSGFPCIWVGGPEETKVYFRDNL